MKKNAIRIVGGQYRRTPIPVVDATSLRPTPDRVRETLFNWLRYFWADDFSNKRVLDLFAGTGALGFEAASNGVAFVQMVEKDPTAITALRALRNKLQAHHVRIHAGDAMHVLERADHPFDLIFLDPPFHQGWLDKIWNQLPTILSPDALIYVESESPIVFPANFASLRQQKAGHVHFQLLEFAATAKTDNNADNAPDSA
ncbi:16S rRNA (guanine(966)-N(2))-methyltransferase RsmD [uncultured Paenalcaligenes sp.]|uniref:16S rRNA (guanine(966)-N(2))-methyltransferase RsmD n=1 Tax=uncultured Paenalcaligenes sp. TaxID=1588925 RepID=UPI002617594C|nr:16S rRNA (guanine(966)-N(2))-methyltransferase RsmD [uncultured Paenalcaligenes sp.]